MTPSSNPPIPSAKEPAAPRSDKPALPPPELEKKANKKLETPILVAIISATVTLVTALLSNPLVLTLVNKPNMPAPTSAAALVTLQNTLLPSSTPGGELIQVPLLISTSTSTGLLPRSSDTPTTAIPPVFQCIAVDRWFPYPTTLNPGISNGCWNLTDWGVSTDQGRLLLVHNPAYDQERGIYAPISGDVDIRFNVQLNEFRTRVDKLGLLNFGIVQNAPLSVYTGGYLTYEKTTPGSASTVSVLISGSHQASQRISDLKVGFQHEVMLSVRDDLMTVYLNGDQIGDPVGLPPTDRAFWIGYVLPAMTELDVTITGFTIQSH
jgi:hypothetical protein